MKIKLIMLGFRLYAIGILIFYALACHAQFYPITPNCCLQAADLTRQNTALQARLSNTLTVLDSTRAVGDRLLANKDARIAQVVSEANTRLAQGAQELSTANAGRASLVAFLRAELLRGQLFRWGQFRRIRQQLRALEGG